MCSGSGCVFCVCVCSVCVFCVCVLGWEWVGGGLGCGRVFNQNENPTVMVGKNTMKSYKNTSKSNKLVTHHKNIQ